MPPIRYLNMYVVTFLIALAALAFGMYFFFGAMNDTSFSVFNAKGEMTYYLNKQRNDQLLNGLVYCITFFIAVFLLFTVIVIPSENQVQQRIAMNNPYSGMAMQMPQQQAPMPQQQAPMPQQQAIAQPMIQTVPMQKARDSQAVTTAPESATAMEAESTSLPVVEEEEDFLEDLDQSPTIVSDEDSDVVYGHGRVTEESVMEFIRSYPDSAIKFLFRKNLDGKVLSPQEEKIYSTWQKRGLSRIKVRQFVLNIMEWENLPEMSPQEMWLKLRDQIFEYMN